MRFRTRPVGAILAGGGGRRIGGDKAIVELNGRPLISYPLEAVRQALGHVAILAKADTKLPYVSGVTVWIEPDARRHPLVGITQALALADGRPVLVCGADLPFVTTKLVQRLAKANPGRAPAVVASADGVIQPLLGCYQRRALELLRRGAQDVSRPVRDSVAAIDPVLLEVDDPDEVFDVDSPADLLQAAAMLDRRVAPY
ncbi:MAG TPA: NTP transferase domain-containing protein [Solirubrobacteraceae bacterium]|jgi:molybdopterin-guanine dinucleotide biosynthesis protein A|nr:NTP transferase domain-containing protein [Solirubrobacteraceae bacterium]